MNHLPNQVIANGNRLPAGPHFRYCYIYEGDHCSCGGKYQGRLPGPDIDVATGGNPALVYVAAAARAADRRGIVDRIKPTTPGTPGDNRIDVHLRHLGNGTDEIRYALEREGWDVAFTRGVGGTPALFRVTPSRRCTS